MTAMSSPMRRCGQAVVCPGVCECGRIVKAEMEAERALLDATDDGGTEGQHDTQIATDADSGRLRTIYGLVTRMKLRGNQ